MTRHGKNNTASSFYSAAERAKDAKASGFGTLHARLTADSIKDFDCCSLTLQPCRHPVISPEGHIFDREAMIEYFLAQKKKINKLTKSWERQIELEGEAMKKQEEEKQVERVRRLEAATGLPAQESLKVAETSRKRAINDRFSSEVAAKNRYMCPVTHDLLTNTTKCAYLKTSKTVVTWDVVEKLIKSEANWVDPLNGKPLKESDIIELKRGGTGLCGSPAQVQPPVHQTAAPEVPQKNDAQLPPQQAGDSIGMSEIERAMLATLSELDGSKQSAKKEKKDKKKKEQRPSIDPENVDDVPKEMRKRQVEVFREMLRLRYEEGKVTLNDSWEHAVKFLGSDPRFRVIQKAAEKKQIFYAWREQQIEQEREECRAQKLKAKRDLELWLREHPRLKKPLRYQRAAQLFADEPLWLAVPLDDRRDLFLDVSHDVLKELAKTEAQLKKRNVEALTNIFQNMSKIGLRTTWADAQKLLVKQKAFINDTELLNMEKMDAFDVFQDFIQEAEIQHNLAKAQGKRVMYRHDRRVRDEFRAFLVELQQQGKIQAFTRWSSLAPTICSDPRFAAMLLQPGSTPLDMFKIFVKELEDFFVADARIVREILKEGNHEIKVDTTYDEVLEWVQADERQRLIPSNHLRLYYTRKVEGAAQRIKDREREQQRVVKRNRDHFRDLLGSLDPPLTVESQWADVLPRIEASEDYQAVESDELREQYFAEFLRQIADGCLHSHEGRKKKKEKKRRSDRHSSDSEDDDEKGKKHKKRRDDDDERDEKRRKRKSQRHSRSRSRSADDHRRSSRKKRSSD
ncbi:unnamed protein product, partial [Mesorhabditis spiculigera]